MNNTTMPTPALTDIGRTVAHGLTEAELRRIIAKRSYATIATVSSAGHPHAAGVLYELIGDQLFVNTLRDSRKARNVAASGRAGVVIPVRRVPVGGPPSAVQFQATADIVDAHHPTIDTLVETGELRSITSHGERELPGSCFLRIDLPRRLHTYGLGMSLARLIRHPLEAGGLVDLDAAG